MLASPALQLPARAAETTADGYDAADRSSYILVVFTPHYGDPRYARMRDSFTAIEALWRASGAMFVGFAPDMRPDAIGGPIPVGLTPEALSRARKAGDFQVLLLSRGYRVLHSSTGEVHRAVLLAEMDVGHREQPTIVRRSGPSRTPVRAPSFEAEDGAPRYAALPSQGPSPLVRPVRIAESVAETAIPGIPKEASKEASGEAPEGATLAWSKEEEPEYSPSVASEHPTNVDEPGVELPGSDPAEASGEQRSSVETEAMEETAARQETAQPPRAAPTTDAMPARDPWAKWLGREELPAAPAGPEVAQAPEIAPDFAPKASAETLADATLATAEPTGTSAPETVASAAEPDAESLLPSLGDPAEPTFEEALAATDEVPVLKLDTIETAAVRTDGGAAEASEAARPSREPALPAPIPFEPADVLGPPIDDALRGASGTATSDVAEPAVLAAIPPFEPLLDPALPVEAVQRAREGAVDVGLAEARRHDEFELRQLAPALPIENLLEMRFEHGPSSDQMSRLKLGPMLLVTGSCGALPPLAPETATVGGRLGSTAAPKPRGFFARMFRS